MATKFADIAKGPKDLFKDDYSTKVSLKCKKAAGPLGVTIETERGSSGGLSSKVSSKFAYAGLSFDKVQMTADGGHALETSLKPLPGMKVSFKGNSGADLGVDYTNGPFYVTGTFDLKDMSRIGASAAFTHKLGFVLGGDTTYALSGKTGISAFNVGASYKKGPVFASVTTASKLSQFKVGVLYSASPTLTIGSETIHSSDKALDLLAVGGAYKSPVGVLKAKVGSSGIVSACFVKEVVPKVTVTASGSVSPSDLSTFKYGLGIVM